MRHIPSCPDLARPPDVGAARSYRELEQENRELRALTERLRSDLAAAEARVAEVARFSVQAPAIVEPTNPACRPLVLPPRAAPAEALQARPDSSPKLSDERPVFQPCRREPHAPGAGPSSPLVPSSRLLPASNLTWTDPEWAGAEPMSGQSQCRAVRPSPCSNRPSISVGCKENPDVSGSGVEAWHKSLLVARAAGSSSPGEPALSFGSAGSRAASPPAPSPHPGPVAATVSQISEPSRKRYSMPEAPAARPIEVQLQPVTSPKFDDVLDASLASLDTCGSDFSASLPQRPDRARARRPQSVPCLDLTGLSAACSDSESGGSSG